MTSQRQIDAFAAGVLEKIDAAGYQLMQIMANPPFIYSAGFTKSYAHPELMMAGFDLGLMGTLMNLIAQRIQDGETFAEGDLISKIINGYDVKVAAIASAKVSEPGQPAAGLWNFPYANLSSNSNAIVLQVLLPDKNGIFPDESGCADELRKLQTVPPTD